MKFFNTHTNKQIIHHLNVWVGGCPHVPADTEEGRSSITLAISHLEASRCCIIDFGIILGDFSTNQNPSELASYSDEGEDCATQLNSGSILTRNKIYTLRGNHDAGSGNNDWYDRYIDRNGVNTVYSGVTNALRPYPISGTDDYYSITTGNILWLFLDDVNDGPSPCGRQGGTGGYPDGSTTEAAYNWWVSMIENNPDKIVITCAHNLLKNTTIATGDDEGVDGGYHGTSGSNIGAGRLHNIIIDKDLNIYEDDQTRFMDYLSLHNGASVLWLGAHTHHDVGETYAGRGYSHTENGCTFINVGNLCLHHGTPKNTQSKILTFIEGYNKVRINNFLHDASYQAVGYNGSTIEISLPVNYKS